ncbi:MAG: hypothetical protein H6746_08485 [Deltaproteobacteria bacterium]|nr:hypothetical protein [Deltaproteobacteria bacterium]
MVLASLRGLDDPREADSPPARWLASWVHCRVFRVDGEGRVRPELARDPGTMRGRTLTVRLVEGARFHDGQVITASDVVRSLRALAASSPSTPLARMVASLELRAPAPLTLELEAPAHTDPSAIRRLLARPEAGVLRGGAVGSGHACGSFRPVDRGAGRATLLAWPGHPRGRPWLDRVEVTARPDPRARSAAFGDQEVDVSETAGLRDRRGASSPAGGLVSAYAIPAPDLRGDGALAFRRFAAALAMDARLVRHADWPAQGADSLWPPLLSPTRAPIATSGPATGPAPPQPALVIAYPEGDEGLGELARGLRDALARLSLAPARAVPVAGLDMASAVAATAPAWQLAVVTHAWGALDTEQAALELAMALGRDDLTAARALAGRGRARAERLNAEAAAIPLLHMERPIHHRSWLVLDAGPSGADLGEAWVRP